MTNEKDRGSRVKGFAAGTVSGLTKLLIGHPFDTIKVRLQCTLPGVYKGPLDCLLQTVRKEGPRALYKGASPPAVGWAMSDAMLMGSLNTYRLFFAKLEAHRTGRPVDGTKGLSLAGHGLSGLLAGWTVCAVVTPIELLKAKLQLQTASTGKLYKGPIDCARQIVRHQGVFGLWHAFPATILFRSHFGSMFIAYELLMRSFKRHDMSVGQSNFFAGGLSSFVFWTGAFPFDVVKNRMMADSITQPKYTGYVQCVRHVYAEGGIKAFYRGFVPCILRAFPTNASAIFAWELTMRLLAKL